MFVTSFMGPLVIALLEGITLSTSRFVERAKKANKNLKRATRILKREIMVWRRLGVVWFRLVWYVRLFWFCFGFVSFRFVVKCLFYYEHILTKSFGRTNLI